MGSCGGPALRRGGRCVPMRFGCITQASSVPPARALGSVRGGRWEGCTRARGASTAEGAIHDASPSPQYRRLSSYLVGERGVPGPSIVALGKFDALHMGHQQLAYQLVKNVEDAARPGAALPGAYLFRLRGVAAALSPNAPTVLPLVAPVDRPRVLGEWSRTLAEPGAALSEGDAAGQCVLRECSIEFTSVRHLSPRRFVEDILHRQLGVGGIVVGPDFRFGYKATGDVKVLRELCDELSIRLDVVEALTTCELPCAAATSQPSQPLGATVRVSSTRLREAVRAGEMAAANALLGRKYRLVADAWSVDSDNDNAIVIEPQALCNMSPGQGEFRATVSFLSADVSDIEENSGVDQRVLHPMCPDDDGDEPERWPCVVRIERGGLLRILSDGGETDGLLPRGKRRNGKCIAIDFE